MPKRWSFEASKESSLAPVNVYLSHIGVVMYMLKTRLEIATSISLLSGQGKEPSELDVEAIFHLASYLLTTATVGLTFYPGSDGVNSLVNYLGFADAAFDVHLDSRSRYGWLVKQDDSEGGAILANSKKEAGPPSDSACTSEVGSLCELIKDIVVIRGIAEELGYVQDSPTIIGEDNQSVCQLTEKLNGKGKRIRHVKRHINFVASYIESKVIQLRQVKSVDQEANVLTKILSSVREHWRETERLLGSSKEITLIQSIVSGKHSFQDTSRPSVAFAATLDRDSVQDILDKFISAMSTNFDSYEDDLYRNGMITVVNSYMNECHQGDSWRESVIEEGKKLTEQRSTSLQRYISESFDDNDYMKSQRLHDYGHDNKKRCIGNLMSKEGTLRRKETRNERRILKKNN